MGLSRDFFRMAIPWTRDREGSDDPALCPACQGPLPDLWAELTDDPQGVTTGLKAIDCYYCATAVRYLPHPATLALGGTVVLAAGEPLEKRTEAKMLIKVGTPSDWGLEVQAYGQPKGIEMKNPAGKRAFDGYVWKEGTVYYYP